jgi:hypothetical protein
VTRRLKEYDETWLENQTLAGILWKLLGAIVAIALVLSVVGFFGGWFNAGRDIISPTNVKAQWQFAYDYDASLDAIAVQWCTASAAEKAETDPPVKVARTDQRIAIENNYQRVAAEYNGRLRDAFRAKLVRPRDVPAQAQPLADNVSENC